MLSLKGSKDAPQLSEEGGGGGRGSKGGGNTEKRDLKHTPTAEHPQ